MLRLFYRGLLRFHPTRFRERFAEEMLSIFDHVGPCPPNLTLRREFLYLRNRPDWRPQVS